MRREGSGWKKAAVGAAFLILGFLAAKTASFYPQEVKSYQFVSRYGLFDGDKEPIYILAEEEPPVISESGVEIRLLSALYKQGELTASFLVRDGSVALADEAQQKALWEKEQKGIDLNGYFCIDEEKKVYASGYFEREAYRLPSARGVLWATADPSHILSFTKTTLASDYEGYKESGTVNYSYSVGFKNDAFSPEKDGGEYELALNGFGQHFKFRMEPTPVYTLKQMKPGRAVTHGPVTLFARASREGELLRVELYRYGESGRGVFLPFYPAGIRLVGREAVSPETDGTDFLRRQTDYPYSNEILSYQTYYFRQPEDGAYHLEIPAVLVETEEQPQTLVIPIPEKEEELNLTVESEDFTIHQTSVKQAGERVYGSRELPGGGEEEMKKSAVYVTMEAESKDDKKSLLYPMIVQHGGEETGYVMRDGTGGWDLVSVDTDNTFSEYRGGVKGFYLLYEEGQGEIEIQFASLRYLWEQEFKIPLEISNE